MTPTDTELHLTMVGLIALFAIAHSGLASLRLRAEAAIGARAYRVLFALISLTLALPVFVFYFNHRYAGISLWFVQDVPGMDMLVAVISSVAFFFLYPATFNLLEVAAIARPQVHLFETGITRISRHPQLTGMALWCIAHTLWLGSSFALVAALALVGYHIFGAWHGDRRLETRYGAAFLALKERTSILPFGAILRGEQQLVWSEFLRPAYLGVIATIVLFRWLHPIVLPAAAQLPL
jgi:uncharacterized membrane protein